MEFPGRLAVVTGASSGIGAEAAVLLGRRRMRVALLARGADGLTATAERVAAAGGTAAVHLVDLGDESGTAAKCEAILRDLGAPDFVLHCAGAGRWLFLDETPAGEGRAMMDAPYFAALHVSRALLPAMLARGSGRLVFVNSPAALMPWPGATGYIAARWALRGLFEALQQDLAGTGVGATHVVVGKVSSAYFAHNPGVEERIPKIDRLIPTLTPEEAAAVVVRAAERGAGEVVAPFMLGFFSIWGRHLPGATALLLRATGARHPATRRARGSARSGSGLAK
jgi:short-subunit dehydrogenase